MRVAAHRDALGAQLTGPARAAEDRVAGELLDLGRGIALEHRLQHLEEGLVGGEAGFAVAERLPLVVRRHRRVAMDRVHHLAAPLPSPNAAEPHQLLQGLGLASRRPPPRRR